MILRSEETCLGFKSWHGHCERRESSVALAQARLAFVVAGLQTRSSDFVDATPQFSIFSFLFSILRLLPIPSAPRRHFPPSRTNHPRHKPFQKHECFPMPGNNRLALSSRNRAENLP